MSRLSILIVIYVLWYIYGLIYIYYLDIFFTLGYFEQWRGYWWTGEQAKRREVYSTGGLTATSGTSPKDLQMRLRLQRPADATNQFVSYGAKSVVKRQIRCLGAPTIGRKGILLLLCCSDVRPADATHAAATSDLQMRPMLQRRQTCRCGPCCSDVRPVKVWKRME